MGNKIFAMFTNNGEFLKKMRNFFINKKFVNFEIFIQDFGAEFKKILSI